ncbi:MAG: FadR family transcriptional regulator [Granulosicoccus sp.]|nr:FadR family transcriptional regulator [Granulosicoccus sp.]
MRDMGKRAGSPEIAARLRRDITTGQLEPRERLAPERELAQAHGVARGTVREALNQLSTEGLVEIRPGSGTYVADSAADPTEHIIANARPLELIDARFALEPHLCRLAVLHARQSDLDQMEDQLSKMENCTDDSIDYSLADMAFHELLAESTGNNLLIWITSQFATVRNQEQWAHMRHLTLNEETMSQYNRQHRQILNAIRTREPERAAALMKQHLETARLSLTRAAAT